MLEHAVYFSHFPGRVRSHTVEGFSCQGEAAAALKLTARPGPPVGGTTKSSPEPQGGIQKDWQAGARYRQRSPGPAPGHPERTVRRLCCAGGTRRLAALADSGGEH